MRRRLPLLVALVVLLACAWRTHQQLEVWQSDLTLWAHAATIAPAKPRPALNYGVALLAASELSGITHIVRASELARLPHVPPWDAAITQRAVAANLRAVGVVR